MKLYIYGGLEDEKVPKDVTHVIIDYGVTIIKDAAFFACEHLVSLIMSDNVKRIEAYAFYECRALRFIRLSKTLEYIGMFAFAHCESLEALFLPPTVKSIEWAAFVHCQLLRILILPNDIDTMNFNEDIIYGTAISQAANTAGVYEMDADEMNDPVFELWLVVEWLVHHMDDSPFHKLCYNLAVTTKEVNDYLNEHGTDAAIVIDSIHGMTPLHMLSMNPHAPADTVAALLDVNIEVAFRLDSQRMTSLDYGREYNVGGLIAMINGLCNHRHAA